MYCIHCGNPFDETGGNIFCANCGGKLHKEDRRPRRERRPERQEEPEEQEGLEVPETEDIAEEAPHLPVPPLHTCPYCGIQFPVLCTHCEVPIPEGAFIPPAGWLPCEVCHRSFWVICPHCKRIQKQEAQYQQMPPEEEQQEQQQQQPGQQQQPPGRITDARGDFPPGSTPRPPGTPAPPSGGGGGGGGSSPPPGYGLNTSSTPWDPRVNYGPGFNKKRRKPRMPVPPSEREPLWDPGFSASDFAPRKKRGIPWWLLPLIGLGALIPIAIILILSPFGNGGDNNPPNGGGDNPPVEGALPDGDAGVGLSDMPFSANSVSRDAGWGRIAGIFTTADGTYFWANPYKSRDLWLIDNRSDKPAELIYSDTTEGASFYAPQFIAGGNFFYLRKVKTRTYDSLVPSVSLATREISWDDDENESMWFSNMAYDGEYIYIVLPENGDTAELRKIDPATRQTLETWTIPKGLDGNVMVLDGKLYAREREYVAYSYLEKSITGARDGRTYAVFDLATGSLSRFTAGDIMTNHLCGNHEAMFYMRYATDDSPLSVSHIYTVKNGQHSLFLDANAVIGGYIESLWLDGEWLYASTGRNDGRLFRIKTDGSTVQQINIPDVNGFSFNEEFVVSGEWIGQYNTAFRIQGDAVTEYVRCSDSGGGERTILDAPVPVTIIK